MMVYMNQDHYIVIVGTIHEGFEFIGPFTDPKQAEEYGNHEFGPEKYDWSCVLLVKTGE